MDWGTIGASVLGSGVVGGGVSYLVARREANDRAEVRKLDREKWEHEKSSEHRKRATAAIVEALAILESLRTAVQQVEDCSDETDDEDDPVDEVTALMDASTPCTIQLMFLGLVEASDQFEVAVSAAGDFTTALVKGEEEDLSMEPFAEAYLSAVGLLHAELKAL